MAEEKKSFVLYADMLTSIDHLTNEEKGILFNHILEYVNDMNPTLTDRVLITAWKPIQLQLKRDLAKYQETLKGKSKGGKKSAELRKQNPTSGNYVEDSSTNLKKVKHSSTKSTDNDNVNDNVNVNVNENAKGVVAPTRAPSSPPELSQFLSFCQTLDDYQPKHESALKLRYESYAGKNWKGIDDWQRKIKAAWPYIKKEVAETEPEKPKPSTKYNPHVETVGWSKLPFTQRYPNFDENGNYIGDKKK